MSNWDDLPVEMMGERPEIFFKKERRSDSGEKEASGSPHAQDSNS
tara:strand:+ start:640 stop:774 length:135 start_codon:yes stop_codon:yes gene_type:complete